MGKEVLSEIKKLNETLEKIEQNQNIISENIVSLWKSIKALERK